MIATRVSSPHQPVPQTERKMKKKSNEKGEPEIGAAHGRLIGGGTARGGGEEGVGGASLFSGSALSIVWKQWRYWRSSRGFHGARGTVGPDYFAPEAISIFGWAMVHQPSAWVFLLRDLPSRTSIASYQW